MKITEIHIFFEFDNIKDFEQNISEFKERQPKDTSEIDNTIPTRIDKNTGKIIKEIKYILS